MSPWPSLLSYGFQAPAVTRHLRGELEQLVEPLVYLARGSEKYQRLTNLRLDMPIGFVSDGASEPRLTWSFLPSKSSILEPALGHDFVFRFAGSLGISFMEANYLIWEMELSLHDPEDVGPLGSWNIWAGVALFGGFAWRGWRKIELPINDLSLRTWKPGVVWSS